MVGPSSCWAVVPQSGTLPGRPFNAKTHGAMAFRKGTPSGHRRLSSSEPQRSESARGGESCDEARTGFAVLPAHDAAWVQCPGAGLILPPPPEGWQAEVTPGFEPSIEKTIVSSYDCNLFNTSFEDTLLNWGPEAIPVIIRLHEDERWADFRRATARMLAQSECPEARQYFLGRFRSLAEVGQPSEQNADEMASLCVNLMDECEPEWIGMLTIEARSGNVAYAPQYAEALLRLGTDEALDAMRVLRSRLPESSRDAVNWRTVVLEGRMRAQEPMPAEDVPDTAKRRRKAPELRKRILALEGRSSSRRGREDIPIGELVTAEGDTAVKFLGKVACDPDFPANVRMQAVVGLGLVGTEKSAKAYARLRDAAFDMPWAPEPQLEYTHAQRMAEAAALTISVIPYMGTEGTPNTSLEARPRTAWVSDDFSTGNLRYGDYHVKAIRMGAEWLVVDVPPIPIP